MSTDTTAYTVAQAAKRLGISIRAMRELVARSEIRAYDVSLRPGQGHARWRISSEAIEDFQHRRTNVAKPSSTAPTRRVKRRAITEYI